MGRLREIPRTSAFAWSSSVAHPLVATGTRAGAVNSDFSDETKLEIWDVSQGAAQGSEPSPIASIGTDSRFYDIAWSEPVGEYSEGIIAGAHENGALDLWDVAKLKNKASDALITRSEKHSGPIKALQFNPHKPELLATAGVKGELYVTDLNNPSNPFRVGATAARADDFDALDWNKKVPHILVTGSSGGFVTVWDVKAKKESLTLNNHGRKPVSAVAWNPDVPTKLATAIPTDQEPLILLWDLRNSSAPERTIRGHDSGILSLSWCPYDSELLLSCGKDNRNICWSASTGQMYGEFPLVTNWTFQTRWSSSHPNLLATASFDSKIVIQSIQNTTSGPNDGAVTNQAADGEDFFAKAQTQPQSSSFSLNRPPKWMRCPVGVSFGFGGKLVKLQPANEQLTSSTIRLEPFAPDSTVASSISEFQDAVKGDDVSEMCSSRASKAADDETKEDWKVIKALVSRSPRNEILSFLGYADAVAPEKEIDGNGKIPEKSSKGGLGEGVVNGEAKKSNRLSAFFENTGEGSNFLSDLAASKDARTNNPFSIFTGSESSAEKDITRALMLGKFEDALDLCLKESRMSDAFMFAICGGQKCIDKVRTAYFDQRSGGPNYLRLLASVVGKNLWDVVYNAELKDWKEVMATLCTFADESEFPDLCEALGDRLEESDAPRTDATFCYLTGSKLEKVVPIWVTEMQKGEKKARSKESETGSAFSIHVQALQSFIEKVSIFRRATNFEDKALHGMENDLKLKPLYSYYTEYAEVAAAHGHLDLAEEYLSLIPNNFVGTDIARNRLKRAIEKPARAARMDPRAQPAVVPSFDPYANVAQPSAPQPATGASYMPTNTFSAAPPQPGPSSYTPAPAFGSSYQPAGAQTNAPPNAAGPPPPGSSGPPPPKATNGANWNDLPDSFQKPPTSRRATPNPGVIQAPPMMNQQGPGPYGPPSASSERSRSPLPPPPKAGQGPPRVSSSGYDRPLQPTSSPPQRPPSSTAASSYAPQQAPRPMQTQPQVARTSSPYNAPPSGPPASNRYAPAPSTQPAPTPQGYGSQPPLGPRAVAPNPYAPSTQYAPQQGQFNQGPPSNGPASQPPASTGPPPAGPPPMARGPPQGPPQGPPPGGPRPGLAQSTNTSSQVEQRHPPGDRSHIPADSRPIFDILHPEMQRVKSKAPANFTKQVEDTEKRLNLLFDALNNEAVPPACVVQLRELAQAIQGRDFETAKAIQTELMKQMEQFGPWMVGVKRLISMSSATPR